MSWPLININDICRPKQWKTVSSANLLEEGYPVYGANGQIGYYSEYTHEFPTLMITCRGATCGNVHISVPKAYINGNAMALDGLDEKRVYIKYLFYYFQSRGFKDVISGSAQPQITRQGLSKIEIPLPPLPVQKQIASVLEKADTLRGQCQQMEQELNTLAQSVFLDMFGDPVRNPNSWKSKKLKDIVSIQSGATPSKANDKFWEGSFPWVSPKDMKSLYISNSIDHISEIVFKETNLKRIPKNTILIVVRGMILAHTVPLAITTKDVSINQDIKALKVLDDSIEPLYLLWCLKSQHNHILGKVSTAAHGTKRLDMPDLVGLDICIPPISTQRRFVDVIEQLDEQLVLSNTSVVNQESLFKSLMQRAFKGELNLKDVA